MGKLGACSSRPAPSHLKWRRDRDSNPGTPVKMLLEFQSSAFDRSAISPKPTNAVGRAALNLCTDWNWQFQSSALLRTSMCSAHWAR